MRYYRLGRKETATPQELTEDEYAGYAEGNVRDLDVALEHGFSTANFEYWAEPT